jgi:hypothetical protein
MVKAVSNSIENLLSSSTVRPFTLVQLESADRIYTYTTLSYDVYLEGARFVSGAYLMAVDTPRNSSSVDREKFRVVLSDPERFFSNAFRQGIIGRNLKVWMGFIDSSARTSVFTSDDVFLAYEGFIDESGISNDFEALGVTITGASPMANLDIRAGYPVSRDGMDQINSNDTSFDFLYKGSNKTLEWGKN